MRGHQLADESHVVGTAHQQHVVVSAAAGQELGEPGRAVTEHDLHLARQRAADPRPVVERLGERIERDEIAEVEQAGHDRAGARATGAERGARDPVVDEQDTRPAIAVGPRGEDPRRIGDVMAALEAGPVLAAQDLLVVPLQPDRVRPRGRAGELVVEHDRVGVVHDPQAPVPQPQAVVGLLPIGGRERRIEPAQGLEEGPRSEKEGPGAEIDVPREHEGGVLGVATAPVTQARTVPPHDAARFLQRPVEQHDPASDGADRRRGPDGAQGRLDAARQEPDVVVQEQQEAAARVTGGEIGAGQEVSVHLVAADGDAAQAVEEHRGPVDRRVVDDDHLVRARRLHADRLQALERQLGPVEGDEQDAQLGIGLRRERQLGVRGEERIEPGHGRRGRRRLDGIPGRRGGGRQGGRDAARCAHLEATALERVGQPQGQIERPLPPIDAHETGLPTGRAA